jgi:carbon-monoxide dehydrogenase medium subunit
MKPTSFDYCIASSIEEVVAKLSQFGADTKILAGGQSLIPMMKMRMVRPAVLLDINDLIASDYVNPKNEYVAIGAMRRLSTLSHLRSVFPCDLIGEALPHIGYDATRNRGTLCGSLAHADPSAEMPVIASCLEAQIVALSASGQRLIPAKNFFISPFKTALDVTEVVTEVRLPILPMGTGWAFRELSKHSAKFALVAVTLRQSKDGFVQSARIAMGAIGDRPIRAETAEIGLEGEPGTSKVFKDAAANAVLELAPNSDVHGTGSYRKKAMQVLVARALEDAWQRSSFFGMKT